MRLVRAIDALTESLAGGLKWLMPLMVVTTGVVVVLRYAFDTGAIALQESVTYMHAAVFMLGIPYALKTGNHVRVDVFYARLPPRRRAAVDLLGHCVFLLPVSIVMAVYTFDYALDSWRILEGSTEVGGIPAVFLLKSLLPVTAVLLLLEGFAEATRCVTRIRSK